MSGNDPETLEREKNKDKEEHFWREDLAVSMSLSLCQRHADTLGISCLSRPRARPTSKPTRWETTLS
jgi:hypothetical protein